MTFGRRILLGREGAAGRPHTDRRRAVYFGCATVRRYGFSVLNPCGNFFLASSSDTDVGMMTSCPTFQFTGVATVCFPASWQGPSRRSTSSKLRLVLIGSTSISSYFLFGPYKNTRQTCASVSS